MEEAGRSQAAGDRGAQGTEIRNARMTTNQRYVLGLNNQAYNHLGFDFERKLHPIWMGRFVGNHQVPRGGPPMNALSHLRHRRMRM